MIPEISIIVPVYNVENYLSRCVDSILFQNFIDFELLLIDDGSVDSSGRICDEYSKADARITVFHTTNEGVSSARNLGLDNAKGKWITFVDSDDWITINYLEQMLNLGITNNVDAVFCNAFMAYENKIVPSIVYKEEQIFSGDEIFKMLLKRQYIRSEVWGKIIRRECVLKKYFKLGIKIGEDLLFLIEIFDNSNCKTFISTDLLYYYFQSNTSAMQSQSFIVDNKKFLLGYLDYKELHPHIGSNYFVENATFIVRTLKLILKKNVLTQSKDTLIMNLLKENFKVSSVNLSINERIYITTLFINPFLCFVILIIENVVRSIIPSR